MGAVKQPVLRTSCSSCTQIVSFKSFKFNPKFGFTARLVARLVGLLLVFTSKKYSMMIKMKWRSFLCR